MNDKQLTQLFAEQKLKIADNGFSDKVMHRLPEKNRTPALVWIFAAISSIVAISTGSYHLVIPIIQTILQEINWWYLPATCGTIALILISIFLLYERTEKTFSLNINI
jgi:hypothetical protein